MEGTLFVDSSGLLGHCWGSGNRLLVYSRPECVKPGSAQAAPIHEVRCGGVFMSCNEFTRRLAKTSFDIFCAIQKNTDPERCFTFSMQYRAALAVCSQEILQFLKLYGEADEAKIMHMTAQYDLIQRLELIWHLAELVFIQAFPSGHLAYNLCSWFHVQSQEAADDARILIEKASGPQAPQLDSRVRAEEDTRFWPTVLSLVLQARPHEAASVLALHSHANSRGLRSLRQLLIAMPIASHTRSKGSWNKCGAAFSQAWNYWQSECNRRLSSGEFEHAGGDPESARGMKLILSILAGVPSVWEDPMIVEATGGSQAWYFRFVSFLFYTDQLVTVDGLSGQLDRWLSNNAIPDPESGLDKVVDILVTNIFRLDFQSFFYAASERLVDNWWFVAHFTNLLHRAYPDVLFCSTNTSMPSKMEENDYQLSVTRHSGSHCAPLLPDYFLVAYVEALASDTSLLSIALGYLDYCETGRQRQSTLLLIHANPVSTRATNWFVGQANSRGLHSTSEQLCRVAARRLIPLVFQEDYPQSLSSFLPSCAALGWALAARDYCVVNRLAEQTLARDDGLHTDVATTCPRLSIEIAEMAAIVLGFFSDQTCADPSSAKPTSQLAKESNKLCFSPELAFLVRYAELQQCFNDGDASSAVDRVIDLLVTSSGSSSSVSSMGPPAKSCLSFGGCSRISLRLRFRLLAEIRHLLGKHCIRRDQVELLIAALIDLRCDFQASLDGHSDKLSTVLSRLHVLLARELASTFLSSNSAGTVGSLPSEMANQA
ncbi:hypothetical protein P879_06219 [Paragonimus westermani]|uniref:Nuclear pore complex protein Nup85 n=1 Tax=Paragonimus westermani TaxID=34504 RepID=A0A8T0DGB7_9TREM|nr:hypothetical protein P879_06219 [Paragonimus westermani]